jgi:L-alanine-DL-glutamate epimerase-like enolase superfamily enzyme
LITEARLTVADLKARAVDVEMERPVQTAAGQVATALMVLIDLRTDEGITGRSYVRSYATFALEPLRRLVENLGAALVGDALAPLEIDRKLQGMFRLLGPQGLTGMAASGIDMAAWDALAKAHGLPLTSHAFPEVSAHLLAASPTAYILEYLDHAGPILEEPIKIEDGHALVPERPGIGLEWDEDAVERFLVR